MLRTHTPSYEDSPSWPAGSVSLQWEIGKIFPGDVLLLSIRKIVFLPPGGGRVGISITSSPTCLLLDVSLLLLSSSLFPPFSVSLSPSICYPSWADICCQAALLFCSSDSWLGFCLSLSFASSFVPSLCLLPPALPHTQLQSSNGSLPARSFTFFFFLCRINWA